MDSSEGENILNINLVADDSFEPGENIIIGGTTIYCSDDTYYSPEDLCINVAPFIGIEQILITPATAEVNLGNTLELKADVTPTEAWIKTLTWNSSDESVATVNEDGLVTPVSKGSVVITATANATNGTEISGSAEIKVTNHIQSLWFENTDLSMTEDSEMPLIPLFTPADAENIEFKWTTDNYAVAYVDSANVLHAVSAGEAVITVYNSASGLSAYINVTVTELLYGDSNDNGIVAIDDVVTDVRYILEKNPEPFSFKKADINKDKKISIVDIYGTVDIILSEDTNHADRVARHARQNKKDLIAGDVIINGINDEMTLSLGNLSGITAMQGDIDLPQGVRLNDISIAEGLSHSVKFAQLSENRVRFVIYSLSLSQISENGPMLKFSLECDPNFTEEYAKIYNVYVSDTESTLMNLESVDVKIHNIETGLNDIFGDRDNYDIYSTQGICIRRNATEEDVKALSHGIYIIGGKRVIVK